MNRIQVSAARQTPFKGWVHPDGKPYFPPRKPSVHDPDAALTAMELVDKFTTRASREMISELASKGYVYDTTSPTARRILNLRAAQTETLYAEYDIPHNFMEAAKIEFLEATPVTFALATMLKSRAKAEKVTTGLLPRYQLYKGQESIAPTNPWTNDAVPLPPLPLKVKRETDKALLIGMKHKLGEFDSWVPKSALRAVLAPGKKKPGYLVKKWLIQQGIRNEDLFWHIVNGDRILSKSERDDLLYEISDFQAEPSRLYSANDREQDEIERAETRATNYVGPTKNQARVLKKYRIWKGASSLTQPLRLRRDYGAEEDEQELREDLVKLAYHRPSFRPLLLPLLVSE